jgi:hypothetical protein
MLTKCRDTLFLKKKQGAPGAATLRCASKSGRTKGAIPYFWGLKSPTRMSKGPISQFITHHYRHFNAAALVDAAKGYETHLLEGGKMMVTSQAP